MGKVDKVLLETGNPGDDADLLNDLRAIVGDKWVVAAPADMAPYLVDWRGLFHGKADAVVRPKTAGEVSRIVQLCARRIVPVVPQGGKTGLVGGAIPNETGPAVLLHMGRMNQIRDLDPFNYTMTIEAGCVLQDVQSAAQEAERFFPLSFGAEGSCQMGGTIATNAGGARAVRYGTARDLVLGLEVVLADGTVWNGLKRVRKDNTGYDLKHLFVGSEGTLGVVTAAVLKLFPLPKERATALVAVRDPQAAVEVLSLFREGTGDRVESCELIMRSGIELALKHVSGTRDPLEEPYDCYLLMELAGLRSGEGLQDMLEELLEATFEAGTVVNAVIAANETQALELWKLREAIVEGQRLEGQHVKLDICVPVTSVPSLLDCGETVVHRVDPELKVVPFGHLGDGNIHFNVMMPADLSAERKQALSESVSEAVYDVVQRLEGSISAEHGLGQLKHRDILRYKSPVDLDLMQRLKQVLDPARILNPGKVIYEE